MRTPDFDYILAVLNREAPSRPTLFEFFMNDDVYRLLSENKAPSAGSRHEAEILRFYGFLHAGYDYVTLNGSNFRFPKAKAEQKQTKSLNDNAVITSAEEFEACVWPEPTDFDYSSLEEIGKMLPANMKIIVCGPGGVLENLVQMVGYENLCYMTMDEPDLVQQIVDCIGTRILKHYEICLNFAPVGAAIVNDDWGFNTQTMLSTEQMRRYIVPWHRRIVKLIHESGRPAILHSCGNLKQVMDDIIDDIGFDGKHSYEDNIMPVEKAYEELHPRIAVLGGIDLNFMCRSTPEQIEKRCREMLERTSSRGGYALGTGNSVPTYLPTENYLALLRTVVGPEIPLSL